MRIFSGIQPSGEFHIGNYLGAMKNWVKLQEKHEAIFCIVDYHAITVDYDSTKMPQRIINAAKDALAVGIDPKKATLFLQSDIPQHTELAWILNTLTNISELEKMTQFKEKSKIASFEKELELEFGEGLEKEFLQIIQNTDWESLKSPGQSIERLKRIHQEAIEKAKQRAGTQERVGLFDYPVLMAADILLYKAEGVPVGEDQVQHVELTRDLARRFNSKYGETFPEPKSLLTETKRIMGLDGQGKMSKSKASSTYIALNDSSEVIRKKIASATTDQGNEPEIEISDATKNLIGLMEAFAGKDRAEYYWGERRKGTIRYSEFKPELAEAIIKELEPIQKRRAEITDQEVKKILALGASKLQPIALDNLVEIKKKMGLSI